MSTTPIAVPRGSFPRIAAAVLEGFVAVVGLSSSTDQVLHSLGLYPPWSQPMRDPGLNLLALAYRCLYAVVASFIAASLAPRDPMRHAMILGWIGLVLGSIGAVASLALADLGPRWYPIALVLTTLPCAWLGGWAHRRQARGRRP